MLMIAKSSKQVDNNLEYLKIVYLPCLSTQATRFENNVSTQQPGGKVRSPDEYLDLLKAGKVSSHPDEPKGQNLQPQLNFIGPWESEPYLILCPVQVVEN